MTQPATVTAQLDAAEYMTVTEIAAVMRLSKMTVYRLINTGELEATRIGRSFRVRAAAVTAYLAAHTAGA